MLRSVLTLALLFLTGCETHTPPSSTESSTGDEQTSGADAADLSLPLTEILDHAYERAGDGSLTVLTRLGDPQRVETEPIENRHVPGQIDTLRTHVYDGLELEVYAVAGGKEILQEVRVTGEGYETAEGLGVGSTRDAVREALGEPAQTERDQFTYRVSNTSDNATDTLLTVRFDGDRVDAMTWSFYVD